MLTDNTNLHVFARLRHRLSLLEVLKLGQMDGDVAIP